MDSFVIKSLIFIETSAKNVDDSSIQKKAIIAMYSHPTLEPIGIESYRLNLIKFGSFCWTLSGNVLSVE